VDAITSRAAVAAIGVTYVWLGSQRQANAITIWPTPIMDLDMTDHHVDSDSSKSSSLETVLKSEGNKLRIFQWLKIRQLRYVRVLPLCSTAAALAWILLLICDRPKAFL
jgi:hypothetical protein